MGGGGKKNFHATGHLLYSLLLEVNSSVCNGGVNDGPCIDLPPPPQPPVKAGLRASLILPGFWELL